MLSPALGSVSYKYLSDRTFPLPTTQIVYSLLVLNKCLYFSKNQTHFIDEKTKMKQIHLKVS